MTEQHKMPDSQAAEDPRVSKAYNELARERAPDHLDAAVLREATRATRPRYSRLRMWTRPAAWAATVILSAALLLEFTRPPERSGAVLAPDADRGREAAKRESSAFPGEVARDAVVLEEAGEAARPQQQRNDEPAAVEPESRSKAALSAEALAPASVPALQTATAPSGSAPACDESQRASAETWLACIEALEQAGMGAAVREERQLFMDAFPDFEAPWLP